MKKCAGCDWKYPPEFMHRSSTERGQTEPVCGICALAFSNISLGLNRKKFDGPLAEDLRQRALEWRKMHTQDGKKLSPTPSGGNRGNRSF